VVARYALAEDAHQFSRVVVEAVASLPGSVERMGDPVGCPLPGTKIEGLCIAFLRSPGGVVFEFVERPLRYFS